MRALAFQCLCKILTLLELPTYYLYAGSSTRIGTMSREPSCFSLVDSILIPSKVARVPVARPTVQKWVHKDLTCVISFFVFHVWLSIHIRVNESFGYTLRRYDLVSSGKTSIPSNFALQRFILAFIMNDVVYSILCLDQVSVRFLDSVWSGERTMRYRWSSSFSSGYCYLLDWNRILYTNHVDV